MDTFGGDRPNILVVEDNPFNRHGLVAYLHGNGYATTEAADVQTAMALATQAPPPLAIVDIVLPPVPSAPAVFDYSLGLELVTFLKSLNPRMGIVIFSAYQDRVAEVWGMVHSGMRGIVYLLKGDRPERMLMALDEAAAGTVLLEPRGGSPNSLPASLLLDRLSPTERPYVERALERIPDLSPRFLDIAQRIAASETNQSIGRALNLSQGTIDAYAAQIFRALGLHGVDEDNISLRKAVLLAKAFMLYNLINKT